MPSAATPIRKVLVANRGEIALRVLRGCRDYGAESVAVYSEIDRSAAHVRSADEAYLIGPAPADESYLHSERIIAAAQRAGADAIHPGYGFLAENSQFARACEAAGLRFIGPSADSMEKVGNKVDARRTMGAAGIPLIPGTPDPIHDPDEAIRIAGEIGYPVIVKAAAGGGGKGIREVAGPDELPRALANCQEEARAAFGDDAIFIEKLLRPVRHIEIQILADQHGNVITLGERECSLQRRRQKLIEEAPSPVMTPPLRARMEEAAKQVARACDYINAGTVEFLVWDSDQFAFLEMNTRLQVEHPITELTRGVDLVVDQLRVAAGETIGYREADRPLNGWAIECRIAAEDPYSDFLPATGTVHHFREPSGPGVRLESGLYPGMEVSVHYDPLLAKLVTWGEDREQARRRMLRALREFQVIGLQTNLPFHEAMLEDPRFIQGDFSTDYVEQTFRMLQERPDHSTLAALAAAAFLQHNDAPSASQCSSGGTRRSAWRRRGRGAHNDMERGWRRS